MCNVDKNVGVHYTWEKALFAAPLRDVPRSHTLRPHSWEGGDLLNSTASL